MADLTPFSNLIGADEKFIDLGDGTYARVVGTVPSAAYDPIFDHDSGKKTSVTASALVITPPAGCKWVRVSSNVDILLHTAGEAAVDNDETIYIVANIPEIVPATAGVAFYALSTSGTATVRCTPLKARA